MTKANRGRKASDYIITINITSGWVLLPQVLMLRACPSVADLMRGM